MRGEECHLRTVLSWLLAKWVVGESEEARRRTLSSHGPENPKEKEIALSWESGYRWPLDQRRNRNGRFSSRPFTGGRSGTVLPVSWERANSNISGLPASGPLRRLPGRLGAWLGRGGRRSPARGSTRRPRYRFGLGRSSGGWSRTVPLSGGVSWAQVHRDRTLHLGNARVPPGHSAVEGSEDGGGGRAASGRERGHPRLFQLLMYLREERHRGRARLWAAPRSEKSIVQPRGLGTGRSVDLQPDAHGCLGKHGRQLWVRCCDRHPIYRWCTEWNAGCPMGQTSEITREPDGMLAAWGVRGPWVRARRRGS